MKKIFFLFVFVVLFVLFLTACSEKNGEYFGIVYDSCNLGQCVQVEKRWDSRLDFFLDRGNKYCLIGQKGNATFFSPDGFHWEKTESGNCYQIIKD